MRVDFKNKYSLQFFLFLVLVYFIDYPDKKDPITLAYNDRPFVFSDKPGVAEYFYPPSIMCPNMTTGRGNFISRHY